MKEIIKSIYKYVDNKFYFKLFYLFVSLTFVTILKELPGISLISRVSGKIAVIWGIILILFMIVEDYKRRKIYKFDIPLALFMIITLIFNIFVYRSTDNISKWIVNLIMFLIIFTVDVFRSKKTLIKEMNIITYFYVIFMLIASIISLIMRFTETNIEIDQIIFGNTKGIFENENALSIATALAIVMCIYLYHITATHRLKLFWLANIVLQAVTMVGSRGRSAYLIVIAVIYIFIFVYNKNKYFRAILLIIPILACGVFFQLDKNNIRNFTSGRSSLWTSGAIVIKEHPFTGVGNNNLVDAVTNARQTDDLPGLAVGGLHNIYVQTATINGVIALTLFLIFLISILVFIVQRLDKLQRKERLQMITLTSIVVGIISVNLFESDLLYIISFISMTFWIYLGYIISILDNKSIE
ncbi:O-antigen polymerase [Clostridium sp. DL-VIII]|uniref:O-antigen ligase family protein n=1 Tax=Clostridium sp. DL-VIII TaxID=641107 RepID=UPI00023AF1D3|nr:O-antigen ligase family protein [Clostridium sp. DL-VIII]EHI98225.1 O-antigen polymerase [Clostridium sp. DL-VIII]